MNRIRRTCRRYFTGSSSSQLSRKKIFLPELDGLRASLRPCSPRHECQRCSRWPEDQKEFRSPRSVRRRGYTAAQTRAPTHDHTRMRCARERGHTARAKFRARARTPLHTTAPTQTQIVSKHGAGDEVLFHVRCVAARARAHTHIPSTHSDSQSRTHTRTLTHCSYEDGDEEDLSMMEITQLVSAPSAGNTRY